MNETKKRSYLVGLIIASALPAIGLPALPGTLTTASVLLYVSAVFGYIGIVLLLWMYALGAKSIFGLVFRDISSITHIHRWLGKYGLLFILAHPILITLSYGEGLFYSLVPHISSEFERHVTLGRISLYLVIMLWVSSVLLRKKMGYRPWKYLHFLAYIALPFSLLHVPGTGSQFANDTFVKVYYFGLVVTYFIVTLLRIRGILAIDANKATVVRHQEIAKSTYMLEVSLPKTAPLPKPGQYVYIRMGIVSEDHPFSVVQTGTDTHTALLAYRVTGRYSQAMARLQPGQSVYVSNPYGAFLSSLDDDQTPVVFVAGGIGVTPFMQALLHERSPDTTWLFYANRSRATTAFMQPLAQKLGAHSIMLFSDEPAVAQNEIHGRITMETFTNTLVAPKQCTYYICGPQGMMNHTLSVLQAIGVPKKQIHTEAFEF